MKSILRWFMLCAWLLMPCFSVASAEDLFHLIFPCESGTVIAATVSEWPGYGYIEASVQAQYRLDHLPDSAGEVTVKGIEINGKPCALEEADVDRHISGSRVDYRYRIAGVSGETVDAVSLTIAEHLADGERLYTLDLPCGQAKWMFSPAIVRALVDGNIYDAPSASGAAIGHLHDGAKLTIYFATEDGWAAIGVGSRDAELWGYMRMQDLYLREEEIHRLTSDIKQWDVQDSYAVYGDAGCTHVLHEVQNGDYVSVLGCIGDVSFIQTGSQYGYVPTETLRSHSGRASAATLVYKADVRGALVTTRVLRDRDCRITVGLEYTLQYTSTENALHLYNTGWVDGKETDVWVYGIYQTELRYFSYTTFPKTVDEAQKELSNPPEIPTGTLSAKSIHFTSGKKYEVYQGPGEEYGRAGNGKAVVSTNDWIQVFGVENDWILIQYDITSDHMRIGWITASALPRKSSVNELTFTPVTAKTIDNVNLTDDPFCSQVSIKCIPKNMKINWLATIGEWAYIEYCDSQIIRGFVPSAILIEDVSLLSLK